MAGRYAGDLQGKRRQDAVRTAEGEVFEKIFEGHDHEKDSGWRALF